MAMKDNQFFKRFYHKFFIFLPVFIISILIIIVYLGYNLTYLKYLLESNQIKEEENFFLRKTSSLHFARSKGIFLFIISLFNLIMTFISYFKTVFTNPGYFPSPLELEYKILNNNDINNNNNNKNKNNFLSKLSDIILEKPLTSGEEASLEKYLKDNYGNFLCENNINAKNTNDEIIEINKLKY